MSFDLIPAPYGSVIFCDDIRDEIGGKTTIVGCYTSDLVANSEFPITLPKFGMACRLVFDKFEGSRSSEIVIVMPGQDLDNPSFSISVELDSETLSASGIVASDPERPRYLVIYNIVGGPFRIMQPGMIQVFLKDRGRTIRIGVLRTRQAEPGETP